MERLLDYCKITGSSVKKYDGVKKYIATGDVDINRIVSGTEVNYDEKPSRANVIGEIGDVCFAKMKDTVKVVLIDEETQKNIYSTGFCFLQTNEQMNNDFLYWYLLSDKFNSQKNRESSGATQKAINNEGLSKILITEVPPIDVQIKVVDKLDNLNKIIEIKQKQLNNLDELVKSQFIEMFGDIAVNMNQFKTKYFNEIATIDTKMVKDFYQYADYPHIGIENIEKHTGKIINYKLIKDSNLVSGKYIFNEQNIIYSKIRPNLNKVATPKFKGLCSADAYPILAKENINKEYLAFILRSQFFLNYILGQSDRTNIPKVNKEQLNRFKLPVPPIELQNKFADFVQHIDKLKIELQESLEKLKECQNALMDKYFG